MNAPLLIVSVDLNVEIENLEGVGFMDRMTVVIAKLSERQMKKEVNAMREAAKSISMTPAKARSFLIEKGFITKANKLTRKYG